MKHTVRHGSLRRMTAGALAAVLLLLAPQALAAEGTVNTKSLVLRKEADKDSRALQTLDQGDRLNVLSETGSWYKVSYGRYTGYVMKKYVKVSGNVEKEEKQEDKKTASSSSTGESAPATCRPGDKGSDVKKLQRALKAVGVYSGKIDGVYGKGTTAAVKAYQKKHGLTQDGVAGQVTLKTLFGEDAGKDAPETEKLAWFGSEDVIPKGATVTIKDCKTGKTFTAVRWSGSNHMDTEPASKADTATLKEIYGGSWSWRRRPILVKYNGHVYAASMNGMPHGTSTIDNGFDGHFCVHFSGSKTHGTDRVDEDHQSAVAAALKYEW